MTRLSDDVTMERGVARPRHRERGAEICEEGGEGEEVGGSIVRTYLPSSPAFFSSLPSSPPSLLSLFPSFSLCLSLGV